MVRLSADPDEALSMSMLHRTDVDMESQTRLLQIEHHSPVVYVRFTKRLIDASTIDELYQLIGEIEEDTAIKGLVFRLGRVGPHLGPAGRLAPSIARLGPNAGVRAFTHLEKVLATLERLPQPGIVLLDGPIGSVGLELALVADLVIATPETVFYIEGLERGFLPGMALYRLSRHVGVGFAKQVLLHRSTISAHQAQRYGIVHRVARAPRRALRAELPQLLTLPPEILHVARQILHEASAASYPKAYDSYKAAQFHALHGLSNQISAPLEHKPMLLSAAEYVLEPIREWIEEADPSYAKSWQSLAEHAFEDADADAGSVLRRLDQADIDGAVLYPAAMLSAYGLLSGPALSSLLQRYNDWILEMCASAPARLRPAILLNVDNPEAAAAEVHRTAADGAAAAVIPLFPHNDQRYDNDAYEVLWGALEQCRVPITLHRGSCRGIGSDPRPFDLALHRVTENDRLFEQVFDALEGSYARLAITAMTLSGVFARHPDLRVVTVGFGLAWAPYTLLRLDEQYEVRPERAGRPNRPRDEAGERLEHQQLAIERSGYHFPDGERPSDHFRRHVFVAVDDDPVGLELTDVFGAHNILWASQQRPLPASNRMGTVVKRIQGDLSRAERAAIEMRNASALYGLFAGEASG
jgi:enoyl-CoA hydratase/carnithine racemase/predicted TIM-barrel fold metal-dependent hydrolase